MLAATGGQWQYRTDIGARTGRSRFRRRHWRRQRHRRDMGRHHSPQFAVDIACDLHRARLGKMHAIGGAQSANLPFKVRALDGIASLVIDETIPDVDIDNSTFFGALAVKLVQVAHIAGRFRAADGGQSHPDNRHAFALKCRDHVVDAFGIERRPWVGMKLIGAARHRPLRIGLGGCLWRRFGIRRHRGLVLRRLRSRLIRCLLCGLSRLAGALCIGGRWSFVAQRRAIIEPEHYDDGVRLFIAQRVFDGLRPFQGLVLGVVAD